MVQNGFVAGVGASSAEVFLLWLNWCYVLFFFLLSPSSKEKKIKELS